MGNRHDKGPSAEEGEVTDPNASESVEPQSLDEADLEQHTEHLEVEAVPPPPVRARPEPSSSEAQRSSAGGQRSRPSASSSSRPASEGDAWIGKLIAQRYQIERELAAGGMGRVYVAIQQPLGRPVAIKVVRTEIHGSRQQFLRRFFLEAASCAKLTHPNIVTIHDYGETEEGEVFMAMEFLDGRALDKEIKDTAPMPPERALHIGIQVSRALREAHAKGIIHRDLKPQNVMLVDQGDEHDFVKVLDFGLVKMLTNNDPNTEEVTRAGVLLGSPNYMSPEQILGGNLDGRTDIYSLGVVMFKMMTGKNPFVRDAETDVIYKHVHHAPPRFADMGVTTPPGVEAVIMRCLAKEPSQRYADCKDLVIALKEARREALGLGPKKKKKRAAEAEGTKETLSAIVDDPANAAPILPPLPVAAPSIPPPAPAPPPPPKEEPPRPKEPPKPAARVSVPPARVPPSTTLIPSRMYLRERDGAPIGPLVLEQIELLYATKVLDDTTPISGDGASYEEIGRWTRLREHLADYRQKLVDGGRPFDKRSSIAPQIADAKSMLALLFRAAGDANTGVLSIAHEDGRARLSYVEGKIVDVSSDAPSLSFGAYLVAQGAFTSEAFASKIPSPPARASDLAGALIGAGLLPPHLVMEKLVAWAKWVIASSLDQSPQRASFAASTPDPPPIPLGLDRFGALAEAVRAMPEDGALARTIDALKVRPAIPSSPNGATIDDFKLPPRELRVLRGVDGTKTFGELIGASKGDAPLVRRALYLAVEVGLIVAGEDQNVPKDRAEAQRLHAVLTKLREKTPFEVLSVGHETNDDEVRSRYMELVKQYHPDNARQGAAPELVEAMRALFNLAQEVYAAIETAEKRSTYKAIRELGYSGKESEGDVVRRVLEAEIAFKKAKTFIKLRKYDDAVLMMKDAIQRKPKDLELKIHLRYFELLADKGDRPRAAAQAIEDILKMLKVADVEIGSAYLVLGQLAKMTNDDESALKFFKKVLKFDEKNHEAESEIRLITLREQKKQQKKGGLNIGGLVRGLGGNKEK